MRNQLTMTVRGFFAALAIAFLPNAGAQTAPPWSTGTYSYDGAGNIKSIGSDSYAYDELGRIRRSIVRPEATLPQVTQTFEYDGFGNITKVTTGDLVVRLGTNSSSNRMDQQTLQGIPVDAFAQYDDDGNVTGFGADHFVPAAEGPMEEWTSPGRRVVYVYTPSDERIGSVQLSETGTEISSEWMLRDTAGGVLRRFTRTGGIWKWDEDYVYMGDRLLAAEVSGRDQTIHFHLDHLGSPRVITGNGGVKLAEHKYAPFGAELTSRFQDGEVAKFTGHERDDPSLDYMHARYYNPNLGRFLSVDPVLGNPLNPQSWNRYTYVLNNPTNFVDPYGLVERNPGEKMEGGDTCNGTVIEGWCTGNIITVRADPMDWGTGMRTLEDSSADMLPDRAPRGAPVAPIRLDKPAEDRKRRDCMRAANKKLMRGLRGPGAAETFKHAREQTNVPKTVFTWAFGRIAVGNWMPDGLAMSYVTNLIWYGGVDAKDSLSQAIDENAEYERAIEACKSGNLF